MANEADREQHLMRLLAQLAAAHEGRVFSVTVHRGEAQVEELNEENVLGQVRNLMSMFDSANEVVMEMQAFGNAIPDPVFHRDVSSAYVDGVPEATGVCFCLDDDEQKPVDGKLVCGHSVHRVCMDEWMKEHNTCPFCQRDVVRVWGDQPEHAALYFDDYKVGEEVKFLRGNLSYMFGQERRTFTFYVPNEPMGVELVKMFNIAFEKRLLFTVNSEGRVLGNGVNLKTSVEAGPFGFPDPTYLPVSKSAMADMGIH